MSSPWVLSSLAALTFGSLGCNVIFGIEPGTLGEGASGPSGGSGAGSQGGDPSAGGAGGGVGGGEIGGGGDGGAGGSPPAQECDPTLLEPGETIGANCGLFVDGSTTRGSGTQASPFNHAQAAFTANLPGNIYICGATTFVGHFVLNGGGRVYGGLTCDWQADGELVPELRGDGTVEEAVFISGAIGDDALLDHLFIRGANAAPGGSSFGLKIDRVSTVLRDVSILAGDAGAAVTQAPGSLGSGGVAGTAAASTCTVVGGAGGSKTCGGTNVSGGNGAACTFGVGNSGFAGMGPGAGDGGAASGTFSCGAGFQGAAGGNGGVGAPSPPVGFLDSGSYVSAGAPDAPSGSPGGGGGGGGSRPNSNGGGGGSGGCGGDGGRGGQNGGASFALVVISAQVELFDVGMSPGRGGDGSDGTAGLAGGFGGAGSAGNANGCAGASGGVGGRGGPGGAGSGGPSAAVAVFDAMVLVGDTTLLSSAGGDAGMPGMNMSSSGAPIPGPAGSAGLVCAALVFDSGGSDPVCQPTLL